MNTKESILIVQIVLSPPHLPKPVIQIIFSFGINGINQVFGISDISAIFMFHFGKDYFCLCDISISKSHQ